MRKLIPAIRANGEYPSHLPLALPWSLGDHVTLIKDATAAFEQEGMHAAPEVNGPRFAHAILTTGELLALLPC